MLKLLKLLNSLTWGKCTQDTHTHTHTYIKEHKRQVRTAHLPVFHFSFPSESSSFLLFQIHVGLVSLRILGMHETVSAVGDKCLHRRSPVHLSKPPHTPTQTDWEPLSRQLLVSFMNILAWLIKSVHT